ncbi:hypothetical protein GCM10010277_88000 [Streptomyces longisporoflavus]|nr:hypothetical protein GCM10010277_88000 [Streptomyces longisporoflavus]
MSGVRSVVDGGGGAGEVGGVLLRPVPGAGLPAAAGVAFWCCGNAVGERLARTFNTPRFSRVLSPSGGCFQCSRLALCLRRVGSREGGR